MTTKETLLKNLDKIDKMPSIPVVVAPLLRYLEQPVDQLDVQKVVSLLAQDKSLTAQSLHMANSPLFGHWQTIDSLKGAVVAFGFQRLRDIVISCSLLRLMPIGETKLDPVVFWEHSLGCALVCRHFAKAIAFPRPEKAYLGGLLHDLGVLVNVWILPSEFGAVMQRAQAQQIPLHEVEQELLGITHCETGRILAERWGLTADLIEVVSFHHDAPSAKEHRPLVALVALSDLLCRMGELGHGYQELRQVSFQEEPAFAVLLQECPALKTFDWARLTFELDGYLDEVRRLVHQLYRTA
jgi:HD-like signal output (HDOD) protein